LSEEKKKKKSQYVMLSFVEKVLKGMALWNNDENEQQIAYYRRAASFLDVYLKGLI
jgi:hypothetical protein